MDRGQNGHNWEPVFQTQPRPQIQIEIQRHGAQRETGADASGMQQPQIPQSWHFNGIQQLAQQQQPPRPWDDQKYTRKEIQPTPVPNIRLLTSDRVSPWIPPPMMTTPMEESVIRRVADIALGQCQAQNLSLNAEVRQVIRAAEMQHYDTAVMLQHAEAQRHQIWKSVDEVKKVKNKVSSIHDKLPTADQLVQAAVAKLAVEAPPSLQRQIQKTITDEVAKAFEKLETQFQFHHMEMPINESTKRFISQKMMSAFTTEKADMLSYIQTTVRQIILDTKDQVVTELTGKAVRIKEEQTMEIEKHQQSLATIVDQAQRHMDAELRDRMAEFRQEMLSFRSYQSGATRMSKDEFTNTLERWRQDEVTRLRSDLNQTKAEIKKVSSTTKAIWEALLDLKQEAKEREQDRQEEIATTTGSDDRQPTKEAMLIRQKIRNKSPFDIEVLETGGSKPEVTMMIEIVGNNVTKDGENKERSQMLHWTPDRNDVKLDYKELDIAIQDYMYKSKYSMISCHVAFTGKFPPLEMAIIRSELELRGWQVRFHDDLGSNMTKGILPTLATQVCGIVTPCYFSLKPMPRTRAVRSAAERVEAVDHSFVTDSQGAWGRIPTAYFRPEQFSMMAKSQINCSVLLARRIHDALSQEISTIYRGLTAHKSETAQNLARLQEMSDKNKADQEQKHIVLTRKVQELRGEAQELTQTHNLRDVLNKLQAFQEEFQGHKADWKRQEDLLQQTRREVEATIATTPTDYRRLTTDLAEIKEATKNLTEKCEDRDHKLQGQVDGLREIGKIAREIADYMKDKDAVPRGIQAVMLQKIADVLEEATSSKSETRIKVEPPEQMDETFDLDIIDELDYMMSAFPLSRRTQTTDNGKTKTATGTGNHLNDDKAC